MLNFGHGSPRRRDTTWFGSTSISSGRERSRLAFNNFEHLPGKPSPLGVRYWDDLCGIEQWGEGTIAGSCIELRLNLQPQVLDELIGKQGGSVGQGRHVGKLQQR